MSEKSDGRRFLHGVTQQCQTFPNNGQGLYQIRLPESLRLQGHWKVGLVSLIFPSTFASPTIDPLTMVVSFQNIETEPTSTIETVGDLTDAI